jgi:hypothetical protein
MAMNHANSQYNTNEHVNIARHVRQARTGIVANPTVQSVGGFLQNPLPTFTSPASFNPGHFLPTQDLTGAPPPMTAVARSAVWSNFAANVSKWFKGYDTKQGRPPVQPFNTPASGTGARTGFIGY